MKKTILKVENLHYAYWNGKVALNDVSVDIREGEKIAVMGSNGSGKSTFFLNINGVFAPERGKITYRETLVTKKNLKELRKNIGIVFQDADNQIVASTVRAEVGFGPMNLKLPMQEVHERVEESLAYMNITDFKDRPPHYLSGGEKKRVSIASILAMRPEMIIFDEPTAALDPLNATMLEDVLAKLGNVGKTILLSTHDVDLAYRWAERVLVFSAGEIIADGTPLDIFRDQQILEKANLKKPMMLEVYEMLVKKKLLEDSAEYPKTTQAFNKLLDDHVVFLGDLA
ncbi:energy-coupling factor ABC transporter ATP-binding protein [Fusibacter ferrireducens]|uniref:ABC transporter ATP-binding protein n=1 Tax=Fusibacter ferrireducens TaxID=2785058 RepID=A0ABR9ZSH0_9FIRM|nr:ATP-binding cassette domain-containing protein [Fusibacter ferrireducens]MBF4693412.1 ATP-binding cassette domain-containing protein [Fusibacter ferrireducens]